MDLSTHELLFSKNRLSSYLAASGGDSTKAILLYKYNIQLSQSLYPLISVLEVSLRNAIDRELSIFFNDSKWLITKRNDFSNHPNLTYKDSSGKIVPDHFFTDKLRKAEDKLRYHSVSINHVKLLAELTFGFWVKFFDTSPIKILKGTPLQAFKNKPAIKLGSVHSHLNQLVALRNRISHSEPICFNKSSGALCLTTISNYEKSIIEAIGWIDSDLLLWSEKINFFKPVCNRIKAL